MDDELRQKLMDALPPVFNRRVASQAVGGMLSVGTLANLDSKGLGPKGRVQLGRRTGYTREAYVEWFMSRVRGRRGA